MSVPILELAPGILGGEKSLAAYLTDMGLRSLEELAERDRDAEQLRLWESP